jgi:hypothetical protein
MHTLEVNLDELIGSKYMFQGKEMLFLAMGFRRTCVCYRFRSHFDLLKSNLIQFIFSLSAFIIAKKAFSRHHEWTWTNASTFTGCTCF